MTYISLIDSFKYQSSNNLYTSEFILNTQKK